MLVTRKENIDESSPDEQTTSINEAYEYFFLKTWKVENH